jgi:hypothetical protein
MGASGDASTRGDTPLGRAPVPPDPTCRKTQRRPRAGVPGRGFFAAAHLPKAPQPAIFWSGGRTGWGLPDFRGGTTDASGLAMTPTGTGGS